MEPGGYNKNTISETEEPVGEHNGITVVMKDTLGVMILGLALIILLKAYIQTTHRNQKLTEIVLEQRGLKSVS